MSVRRGPGSYPERMGQAWIVLRTWSDTLRRQTDDWQRGDAIDALTGSDATMMRLLAAGLKDPDREVRLRAILALLLIRIAPDEVCLPALEGALYFPDPDLRAEAHKAIDIFELKLKNCVI